MIRAWRLLSLAAALSVTANLGSAAAQTVIVRKAPPGSVVEVALNGTAVGTGTVNAIGDARVAANIFVKKETQETTAHIYVDVCGSMRRVGLVERSLQAPEAQPGCERREVGGFFVLQPVTTLVIDVGGTFPIVLIRQGAAPAEWLSTGSALQNIVRSTTTGLRLSGGVSLINFRDDFEFFCAETQPCRGRDFRPRYTFGAGYWVLPWLGGEVTYMKSGESTTEGSGVGFAFTSTLEADILAITANVGVSAGRSAKVYGRAGFNYHEAVFTTVQVSDDFVVTVDGVDIVFPGGTETFAFRTGGWGVLFGGGFEYWVKGPFGVYAEGGIATLKGTDLDGGDGEMDDQITYVLAGGRIRLGRLIGR